MKDLRTSDGEPAKEQTPEEKKKAARDEVLNPLSGTMLGDLTDQPDVMEALKNQDINALNKIFGQDSPGNPEYSPEKKEALAHKLATDMFYWNYDAFKKAYAKMETSSERPESTPELDKAMRFFANKTVETHAATLKKLEGHYGESKTRVAIALEGIDAQIQIGKNAQSPTERAEAYRKAGEEAARFMSAMKGRQDLTYMGMTGPKSELDSLLGSAAGSAIELSRPGARPSNALLASATQGGAGLSPDERAFHQGFQKEWPKQLERIDVFQKNVAAASQGNLEAQKWLKDTYPGVQSWALQIGDSRAAYAAGRNKDGSWAFQQDRVDGLNPNAWTGRQVPKIGAPNQQSLAAIMAYQEKGLEGLSFEDKLKEMNVRHNPELRGILDSAVTRNGINGDALMNAANRAEQAILNTTIDIGLLSAAVLPQQQPAQQQVQVETQQQEQEMSPGGCGPAGCPVPQQRQQQQQFQRQPPQRRPAGSQQFNQFQQRQRSPAPNPGAQVQRNLDRLRMQTNPYLKLQQQLKPRSGRF